MEQRYSLIFAFGVTTKTIEKGKNTHKSHSGLTSLITVDYHGHFKDTQTENVLLKLDNLPSSSLILCPSLLQQNKSVLIQ